MLYEAKKCSSKYKLFFSLFYFKFQDKKIFVLFYTRKKITIKTRKNHEYIVFTVTIIYSKKTSNVEHEIVHILCYNLNRRL